MILKNKKALILSSLLILLPIPVGLLLWNHFPEQMAIHFGITGQADGYASVPFAVFVPPLILLAGHWLCILGTCLDKRNRDRNQKPLRHSVRAGSGYRSFRKFHYDRRHGPYVRRHRQLPAQMPHEFYHGHQNPLDLLQ